MLVRLPLALLFTGVSVQIVALALTATDQASAMLIGADGDPMHHLLTGLISGLAQPADLGLAAFAEFLIMLDRGIRRLLLWLELVVRSAAVAAASLFLPLALVGLAWPATSHWARRLGETLAALVLSKLVIAAVLALAAGLVVASSSLSGVVQGVALLAVAAFAPFALLKLVPVVEAGAIAQLESMGRRPIRAAERLGSQVLGLDGGGVAALASLGGLLTRSSETAGAQSGGPNLGPWHDFRPEYASAGKAEGGSGAPFDSTPDFGSGPSSSPTGSSASAASSGATAFIGDSASQTTANLGRPFPRPHSAGRARHSSTKSRTVVEAPRYQLGPRSKRGLVAGWRGAQLAVVGAGLGLGLGILRSAGGAGGALVALVIVAFSVVLVTWPLAGRSAEQWAPVVVSYLVRSFGGPDRRRGPLSGLED